jgi:hypothetical protein
MSWSQGEYSRNFFVIIGYVFRIKIRDETSRIRNTDYNSEHYVIFAAPALQHFIQRNLTPLQSIFNVP